LSGFVQLFEKLSHKYANNISIIFNEQGFTYNQINIASNRLAQGLMDIGFRKGDRIALILPNYVQFPICYFALLKIGVVAFPINFLFNEIQIHELLGRANVKGIITWEQVAKKVQQAAQGLELKSPLIILGENIPDNSIDLTKLIASSQPITHPLESDDEDTAIILHTSATTNEPKAVELSHKNLYSNCTAFREHFLINSDDCIIAVTPLFHPLGITAILNTGFCFGAKINLHPYFKPQSILNSLKNQKVTLFVGIPSIYKALMDFEDSGDSFESMRFCISSWQPLSESLIESFENKFNKVIYEAYGLAEATAFVSINRVDHEQKSGSVGMPLNQVAVKIINEQDNDVPTGEIGEIVVRGPNVMKGYIGQPQQTEAVLQGDWLHTGDMGKIDENGTLYFIERKENVITKGGFHVFPREIETHLLKHPKVKEAVVLGHPDPIQGQEVKACIVPKNGNVLAPNEIIDYCQEAFAVYKCPKIVQFYETFPKSSTGKILRYKLKQE